MRVTRFVGTLLIALFISVSARAEDAPRSNYPAQLKLFLSQTDTAVLFVGRVRDVYTGNLPCTVANTRQVKWDVSRVLYGFDIGPQATVDFPSCGAVEAQFRTHSDMLVVIHSGYRSWAGMKDSVVPANEDNIRVASKLMDDYLRRRVRDIVKPARSPKERPVLAFGGTVLETGPQWDQSVGCPSSVPPAFPVKFLIDTPLHGSWTQKEVTVSFAGCGPTAYPPFRKDQKMVVLAEIIQSVPPPDILRGELVLPVAQSEQLRKALDSAVASTAH
jgi:hypothetical protein